MGKIVFITGGARSGKSSFAMQIAKGKKGKVAFIATCLPLDKEMDERIKLHKK
ncbi:MAG: bifunctional adenosylcobinamide kinase/adenosylcobinamide-phosphate guanylyltransferase, partial [Candidatus Omnitrophica bacterium]|nr:bifunctional adenosylcobinamide kinase/adenosylcobinamide-phosphate guanylyltransferase [Candidatus Omnitrophota bacterium]